MRWVLRAAVVLLVVAVATFLIRGVNSTARPTLDSNGARTSRVSGFDQIGFSVTDAKGTTSRHCALLALTTVQQNRGLMNRRDLAGYDGMLFQFVSPSTDEFYMKDTLISLSIAWFDAAGHYVSAVDMPPCVTADNCPLYQAAGPYTVALEVAQGQLGRVGVGPGSSLTVGGSC